MNRPQISRKRGAAIGACLAGAAVLTFLLLPGEHTKRPAEVAANDYSTRATACLATDTSTYTSDPIYKQIWTGMQTAAKDSSSNAQQLIEPVTDQAAAQPYLAGLINQKCDLIITLGKPFGQAIPAISKSAPQTHFTAIHADLANAPANTTILDPNNAATAIAQQITDLKKH